MNTYVYNIVKFKEKKLQKFYNFFKKRNFYLTIHRIIAILCNMKELEIHSSIFKALGHPVRLKIIKGLINDNCSVNKMVSKLNLPQSTVSQHLGILKNAGILTPHKTGVVTCYRVENEEVLKIMDIIK